MLHGSPTPEPHPLYFLALCVSRCRMPRPACYLLHATYLSLSIDHERVLPGCLGVGGDGHGGGDPSGVVLTAVALSSPVQRSVRSVAARHPRPLRSALA